MALIDELLTLERGFWNAVSDPDYYREHMADDGLAVFGIGVMGKDQAIASTSSPEMSKWTEVQLSDARVLELSDTTAALIYLGSAKREGHAYAAYTTTVYVKRDGRWQMATHQQSEKQSG